MIIVPTVVNSTVTPFLCADAEVVAVADGIKRNEVGFPLLLHLEVIGERDGVIAIGLT